MDSSSFHVTHRFHYFLVFSCSLNESELMVCKPLASTVFMALLPSLFLSCRVYEILTSYQVLFNVKERRVSRCFSTWSFLGLRLLQSRCAEWELQPPLPNTTQEWEDDDHLKRCHGVEEYIGQFVHYACMWTTRNEWIYSEPSACYQGIGEIHVLDFCSPI